jgi:hypothetical protein
MKRILLSMLLFAGVATAQTVTVTVTWEPGAGGQATGFIFQRAQQVIGSTLTYVTITTVPAPAACTGLLGTNICTVSYADVATATNPLVPGGVYYYHVMATNSAGNSPPSSPTSVAIAAPPTAAIPIAPVMVGAIVTYPLSSAVHWAVMPQLQWQALTSDQWDSMTP